MFSLGVLTAAPAHAACTNPNGDPGVILYNEDYAVFQGCTPFGWQQFHSPTATPGCPSSGLVGYWRLNDSTGSTSAADSTGTGNAGLLVNMDPNTDWVAGKLGGALDFDGTNDYVSVADHNALDIGTGDMTFAFWLKSTNNNKDQMLIIKGDPFNGVTYGYGIRWQSNVAGDPLSFYLSDGSGGAGSNYTIGDISNAWHHIVAVFDRDVGFKLYLDDTNVGGSWDNSLASRQGDASAATALYFGANAASSSLFLSGALDDLRIYNRVLSAAEVSLLYNSGAGCQ